MTALRVPKAPLTPPSQGYVAPDIPSAVATFALGSQPLEADPRPVLQLSVPTNGSPELQYQHLMETTHTLQGIALSVRPSCIPTDPEVPLQPTPIYTALPPRPSPQLLTASAMGAWLPPPASAQHYALHGTPFPGDQSFGLVGAQYPTGSLPGTAPAQQLLL